jgi:hypothetical protein
MCRALEIEFLNRKSSNNNNNFISCSAEFFEIPYFLMNGASFVEKKSGII